ncbi:GreA/GreB family elongation factor [Opitutus sp. ER46]|uniref:GreA/GreB family elongation factor n=1 Tax=Opitutus sp. ER46 TaxID=2161864 RepID=UPI000D3213E0|nr:GreA/GreB family elongation factor [Opitutus sp. ER46]PTX90937.1 transcription elongation factor [Opitutus sp. ER46]
MNKTALRQAILDRLQADLAQQRAAAETSRDEAISEESRPENKYDMHSQEAAYLAQGQARLVREISDNIAQYASLPVPAFAPDAAIALGAVVGLANGRATQWYFVGPRAGGIELSVDGRDVLVITPQSPLGRDLVGKRVGDEVRLPGRPAPLRISTVL